MKTQNDCHASEVVQQRLVRLWRSREKTLLSVEMMAVSERLKRELRALGDAYGQCAEELENPPIELLDALGIEADATVMAPGSAVPDSESTHPADR